MGKREEEAYKIEIETYSIWGEDEGAGLLSLIRKKVFFGER